jgi:hypothetical protein
MTLQTRTVYAIKTPSGKYVTNGERLWTYGSAAEARKAMRAQCYSDRCEVVPLVETITEKVQ